MGLRTFQLDEEEVTTTSTTTSSPVVDSTTSATSTAWLVFWLFIGFVLFVLIPFVLAYMLSTHDEKDKE